MQFLKNKKYFNKTTYIITGILVFFGVFTAGIFTLIDNVINIEYDPYRANLYQDYTVQKEQDRLDVLILGIRGENDPEGGLLADSVILASFDKQNGTSAMISIPRDLYVEMPNGRSDKINTVYSIGRLQDKSGLNYAREVIQYITGVYVDHTIVLNFDGFLDIVDVIDGVQITRSTPFSEPCQWQGEGKADSLYWKAHQEPIANCGAEYSITEPPYWEFHIPAGTHTLNGQDALYYVRSRISSNDFQRARRQQEVISAIRQKVVSLDIINPTKALEVLDILQDNLVVDTKVDATNVRKFLSIAEIVSNSATNQRVLEPGADQILQETRDENGRFILVPSSGDWGQVRMFFQEILSNSNTQ